MKIWHSVLCLTLSLSSPLAYAISMGSLSDALEQNSSLGSMKKSTVPAAHPQMVQKSNSAPSLPKTLPNPALFIEDAAITGYIHSQFLLQKNIPRVSVTTENAVVSLKGMVDTQEQADKLVKIASSVKGVKRVNTADLKVRA